LSTVDICHHGGSIHSDDRTMQIGILYAAAAYILWGLFPIYFKALQNVSPVQILWHRVVWAFFFLLMVLAARRQWSWIARVSRQPKIVAGFGASALLLSINWYTYIWAVNNAHVVDASLGYFMNPLVSVLLGCLLLHARLRPTQWTAVALAAAGVAWLTLLTGHPPWIGLVLALSFGFYGLLRKTAMLGALEGLSLETFLLFPVALGYLLWLALRDANAFSHVTLNSKLLLIAAGPITAVPLLLFAAGARRIPMSTLGLLQYLAPTLQLLLGVWLYDEPFGAQRLFGFAVIWSALALYSADGLWSAWRTASAARYPID
jgi:chloramphenicol-sensitive protein RarD